MKKMHSFHSIFSWYIIILLIISIILIIFLFLKKKEGFDEKYLDGIDIIYWINLDRSPDRRESMEKMFQDDVFSGIKNKRISAIDGDDDNIYDMMEGNNLNHTPGVYGCLLSHLNAIKEFNESKYEVALIMEDDCTLELKKYWKKSVKEIIQNAPSDWEIIMLCYNVGKHHDLWNWTNVSKDYINSHMPSTGAYIINKKGSFKIMNDIYSDNIYNLNPNVSHHSDSFIFFTLNTYCYKYPMFIYETENESLLGHDIHEHNISKERIIEQYEQLK